MAAIEFTEDELKKVTLSQLSPAGRNTVCELKKTSTWPVLYSEGGYGQAPFLGGQELVFKNAYQGKRYGVICQFETYDANHVLANGKECKYVEIPLYRLPEILGGVVLLEALLGGGPSAKAKSQHGIDTEQYKNDGRVASWS